MIEKTQDTIDLTPDFTSLRRTFSREARQRASTILADLLPEELIEPEHIKAIQLSVLREFQSILNSLDMVTQCTTNLEQVLELRELVHEVSQGIVKKADEVEYQMHLKCDICGREGCINCVEDGPEEGDWVTNNYIDFEQHEYPKAWQSREVIAEGEDWRVRLKARMDVDKFWPNVWFISDHGNCHQLDMNDGQHIDRQF